MAGNFAGCRPAHAVANDEGAALGQCGAGVLIDVAHPARIREHGEDGGEWAGWGDSGSGGGNSRPGVVSESQHLPLPNHSSVQNSLPTRGSNTGAEQSNTLPRTYRSPWLFYCWQRSLVVQPMDRQPRVESIGLNRIVHGDNLEALRRMASGRWR